MIINKKYYKGMSLVEALVCVIILSGFTFMIMSVFNRLQIKNIQEDSTTYIHNYCNRSIDKIADYVMNSLEGVHPTGINAGFPAYRLKIINKDLDGNPILVNNEYSIENIEIRCTENEGILINGKTPDDNFFKEDPSALTSYTISTFGIYDGNHSGNLVVSENMQLPNEIRDDLNDASYLIVVEVDVIFKQSQEIKKTLTYTRKVFTANHFVSGGDPDV